VENVPLPAIIDESSTALTQLTDALGVPRSILAGDDEIRRAWDQLPRLIGQIPAPVRGELHARMCVAVFVGLFDAAINYAWNSAILALRDKVRAFGIHVVPQIIGSDFSEERLVDLTDAQLTQLCLSLNLINEDAYFFLDQCRDVRNNFSAAHPAKGSLDDIEFVAFLNRCIKYALSITANPKGVDTQALINSVKNLKHSTAQTEEWVKRINATHEAQQKLIISMLHGIYCDPASTQDTRSNSIAICKTLSEKFSPNVKSELITRHSDYIAEGKEDRLALSEQFFGSLRLLGLLTEQELHVLISKACKSLLRVHQQYNNFYNEPPFAERLLEISQQSKIPDTARAEFVETIVTCATGNQYGICRAAYVSYEKMIRNFISKDIAIMLALPTSNTIVASRLKTFASCKSRFITLVKLVDPKQVPVRLTGVYKSYVSS